MFKERNPLSRNAQDKAAGLSDAAFLLIVTIGLFMAMYAAGMILFADKGFANPQNFCNLLNENAALIIISCGLSVVMIAGGIDISVGGSTALICMVAIVNLNEHGGNFFSALAISLAIGLAFGIVQGFLVAYLGIQPFIVTLAGMFFARGMTAVVSQDNLSVKNGHFPTVEALKIPLGELGIGTVNKRGVFIEAKIEIMALVAAGIVILLFLLLKYTKLGRSLYAVGGSAQSALMLGVNVRRTKFLSHVLCGLLAGIGGFVYLLHIQAAAVVQAYGLEMDAIAASIIGGTLLTGGVGNIFGTFFGVLTRGAILLLVTAIGIQDPWWSSIIVAAMLCFFIVLQSVIASRKTGGRVRMRLPAWLRIRSGNLPDRA
jgi:simple sugar transport system permease protein